MTNERITEDIVREHFKRDPLFDVISFEEQVPQDERIKDCLSRASKNKTNRPGHPEFIITFPEFPDSIIIIECKAETKFHESAEKNDPTGYAVDGVIHYQKFLAKKYNVLAIAVSGQEKTTLKVSSFYRKHDERNYIERDNELLSIHSYITLFKDMSIADNVENIEITKTAIYLNENLNDYSIIEYERCTLVSAILLALQNESFRLSYKNQTRPNRIANEIIVNIKNVLEDCNIDEGRSDSIISEFRKIENYPISKLIKIKKKKERLEKDNYVLRDITAHLEQKILPLMLMGDKGYDVLGKFYTEFIRYAGTNQKTGLVLTPKHITEFFCKVADLDDDDVVFDLCCGTGGFLISAMKYIIEKAGNNQSKIKFIKERQICGVEIRPDMFAYACSNMIMCGDGKSNIYQGDSFSPANTEEIRKLKPTVSFLNPPYDVGEAEQLRFIENSLSILSKGGRCIAIVKFSCAIKSNRDIEETKRRLLDAHTLEATFSMPDDLFYPVGVSTCIMVFKAKIGHPKEYKTFFGYFKNDGMQKVKNIGRIDVINKWHTIEKKWVNLFINREIEDGMSVLKKVTPSDEWCAESYLETDYKVLTEEFFKETIKDNIASCFANGFIKEVTEKSLISKNISLFNGREWRWFPYNFLFEIKKGERLTEPNRISGSTPFITAKSTNNGITCRLDANEFKDIKRMFNNKITIDMFYNCFYHNYDYFSDDNIHTLINKHTTNKYIDMFLCTVMKLEKFKWAYGRQVRLSRLVNGKIKLPIDIAKSDVPDWQFMETYIKSLPYSSSLI